MPGTKCVPTLAHLILTVAPYEAGAIIIHILQMKKLKQKVVK